MGHPTRRSQERYQQDGGARNPGHQSRRLPVVEAASPTVVVDDSTPESELTDPRLLGEDASETSPDTQAESEVLLTVAGLDEIRAYVEKLMKETIEGVQLVRIKFQPESVHTAQLRELIDQQLAAHTELETVLNTATAKLQTGSLDEAALDKIADEVQTAYDDFLECYDAFGAEMEIIFQLYTTELTPSLSAEPVPRPETLVTSPAREPETIVPETKLPAQPKSTSAAASITITPSADASGDEESLDAGSTPEQMPTHSLTPEQLLTERVADLERALLTHQAALEAWETTYRIDPPEGIAVYLDQYQYSLDRLQHVLESMRLLEKEDDLHAMALQLDAYKRVSHEALNNIATLEEALTLYKSLEVVAVDVTDNPRDTDAEVAHSTGTDEAPLSKPVLQGGVKTHERTPLKELTHIFGMRLPVAGPSGVFGAKSFYKALLLQKYDQRIKDVPAAYSALEAMLKIVAYVPKDGLQPEEVAQLEVYARELAELIPDSDRVTKSPEATSTTEIIKLPTCLTSFTLTRNGQAQTLTMELSEITSSPLPASVSETAFMKALVAAAALEYEVHQYSTPAELSAVLSSTLTAQFAHPLTITVGKSVLVVPGVPTNQTDVVEAAVSPTPDTESVSEAAPNAQPTTSSSRATILDADEAPEVVRTSASPARTLGTAFKEDDTTVSSVALEDDSSDKENDAESTLTAKEILTARVAPLRGQYVDLPNITALIRKRYRQEATFKATTRRRARDYEDRNYDGIEKRTKEFNAMYDFLAPKTIRDIEILYLSNRDELRQTLADQRVKYEALVDRETGWYEELLRMQDVLPYTDSTTFEDIWQRWCLYQDVLRDEPLAR